MREIEPHSSPSERNGRPVPPPLLSPSPSSEWLHAFNPNGSDRSISPMHPAARQTSRQQIYAAPTPSAEYLNAFQNHNHYSWQDGIPEREDSRATDGPTPSSEWMRAFRQQSYQPVHVASITTHGGSQRRRGKYYTCGVVVGVMVWISVVAAVVGAVVYVFYHATAVAETSVSVMSKLEREVEHEARRFAFASTVATTTTSTTVVTTSYEDKHVHNHHLMLQHILGEQAEVLCYAEKSYQSFSMSIESIYCEISATDAKNCAVAKTALDLARLSTLSFITRLDLVSCHDYVLGDLRDISNLTNLRHLSLASSSVTGNMSSLQGLTKLRHLSVFNAPNGEIAADLRDFQSLTQVEHLSVQLQGGAGLTGHLIYLRPLVKLQTLQLVNIESVWGDLFDLVSPDLQEVVISGPSYITGLIDTLGTTAKALQRVQIERCPIGGGLKTICRRQFETMRSVVLGDTQLKGNIQDIMFCTRVSKIDFTRTLVVGELKTLVNFSSVPLQIIRMADTRVTGKLSDLLPIAPMLIELDLSNTMVDGCLGAYVCKCSGGAECYKLLQSHQVM